MSSQTIPLRRGVVYGPVHSRRLGLSLGINLFPTGHKICPFDCVYCEYGFTTDLVARMEQKQAPSAKEVLQAVEMSLTEYDNLAYITFSGQGEPTLHPDLSEIVDGVVALRNRLQPGARVAMLSCSGVVNRPEVREALARLDDRIMKLDAGDEATFRAMNRPLSGLTLESIIAGLAQLEDVVIQHMVLDGSFSNAGGPAHEAWLLAMKRIQPQEIQIYSVDRPTAEANVLRVPKETLERLAAEVQSRTGIPTFAY
jgi:wyosine [tRNA(Phe)-imidazoG37] synthetase (radical SAM superfamily)